MRGPRVVSPHGMNILFLTIDQHRWDFVTGGAVGTLRTPNIDRLRAAGTTFPNTFSNCPICMPTRFTWTHGLYASQGAAGLLDNAHDWPTDLPTLPRHLQAAGHHTALIGKLHRHAGLSRRSLLEDHEATRAFGFDDLLEVSGKSLALWYDCAWTRHLRERGLWETYVRDIAARGDEFGKSLRGDPSVLPDEDHVDAFLATQAERWLLGRTDARPFYLHASLCGPHFPVDPPERLRRCFAAEAMPDPEGVDDPGLRAAWRERRAGYAALVAHVDEQIGRIVDALEKSGRGRDTLIVLCSDHGEMVGHRNLPNKGTPYDTSIRTPVTFVLPGVIPANERLGALVEAVDLPVTLAEAAGLAAPARLFPGTPGRSLWGLLTRGTDAAPRRVAYAEAFSGRRAWRMVRDQRHKLVVHAEGGDELYDLEADPWELDNLADRGAHDAVRRRLERELLGVLTEHAAAVNRVPCPPRSDWWRAAAGCP